MGHAMAETPAGVARALLYIVRASPTFFLHQSINHSYHTFHQKRAYRWWITAFFRARNPFEIKINMPIRFTHLPPLGSNLLNNAHSLSYYTYA